MIIKKQFTRRKMLGGMLSGSAISVALPFLDCFLNNNGTALADGTDLPLCYGTWFFGLGYMPGRWEPKIVGRNYSMGVDCEALNPLKHKMNVFSGMKCFLDGNPNVVHTSGPQVMFGGQITRGGDRAPASLDTIIAEQIGTRTRFRSLEVSCIGLPMSYTRRAGAAPNPGEISPAKLYARIFGPDFVDPNAADFKPDTFTMVRRSVLSVVSDERNDFVKGLGANDRQRMDQYFTSIRELEQQLDLALQKPKPLAACTIPQKQEELPIGAVVEEVMSNHKLFATLLAHALACGQTQVVNVMFSQAVSNLRHEGNADTHHVLTHEEKVDPVTGVQPKVSWFNQRSTEGMLNFLTALDSIKEGDATLLDRCLIFLTTDVGLAMNHGLENVPMFTAGKAGGRMKTGIHYSAKGDPVTRVGLTLQQVMGAPASVWGKDGNRTAQTISEVVA